MKAILSTAALAISSGVHAQANIQGSPFPDSIPRVQFSSPISPVTKEFRDALDECIKNEVPLNNTFGTNIGRKCSMGGPLSLSQRKYVMETMY